jgi:hypothetical protein
MKRHTRAVAALSAFLVVGGAGVASADNLVADGDGFTPVESNALNLQLSCDGTAATDVLLAISRNGQGAGSPNVFGDNATVTVTVTGSTAGIAASDPEEPILLPANWVALANNTMSPAVSSRVEVTAATSGTGTVTYAATGTNQLGDQRTLEATLDVTWTAATDCEVNEPPTAPGQPVSSTYLTNQGAFTLTWEPATDPDEDEVTYILEGKDADDADFSVIASGLTVPEYTFGAGQPDEGTWVYRVKAVEATPEAKSGPYSEVSEPVKVDRTGPEAPTPTPDRDAEYTDPVSGTSWWKGSVTVSFVAGSDPALPDGSDGSGVDATTPPQTYEETGPFTATGTSADLAGNTSATATLTGAVDATPPVVAVVPGSTQFVLGSTATVEWTASDEGSGLKTPASGVVTLDTSSVGPKTVTLPVAEDNVGNLSAAVTFEYSVVYDFTGFFQPLDMEKPNVAKAGSAIPVKFSLGGDQGLDIFAKEPTFRVTGSAAGGDEVESYVTASNSSLKYDAEAGQYVYVWKTDKAWAGKSGLLEVHLADGTVKVVEISFKK